MTEEEPNTIYTVHILDISIGYEAARIALKAVGEEV